MALNEIQQEKFFQDIENDVDKAVVDFGVYKARLQAVFDVLQDYIVILQGYIDDGSNPQEFKDKCLRYQTICENYIAQGKVLIQNMLDGIT